MYSIGFLKSLDFISDLFLKEPYSSFDNLDFVKLGQYAKDDSGKKYLITYTIEKDYFEEALDEVDFFEDLSFSYDGISKIEEIDVSFIGIPGYRFFK